MPQPVVIKLLPGDYLICGCGKSAKSPYCDGSHSQLELEAKPSSLTVTAKTGLLWLCTCGASNAKPHCDGSHNKLP